MKVIIVNEAGDLFPICDSAIGRDVMPLFVPDAGSWTLEGHIAFRIGRLGKSISEKFAYRYVDAIGTVAFLKPESGLAPWVSLMDNVITTGQWLPLPEEDINVKWKFDEEIADVEVSKDTWQTAVTQSIAKATAIATIKTGDIIIAPLPSVSFTPSPNHLLVAEINASSSLYLKIK